MEGQRLRFIPDKILLGDDSRYEFLAWLLPDDIDFRELRELKEHPVWLRYGTVFRRDWQGNEWIITTPALLPRTILYIPSDERVCFQQDLPATVRYIIFETHPYEKEENEKIFGVLAEKNAEILMVLMNLPRRHASTDLSKPGEDLAKAESHYQKCGQVFRTIKDSSNVISVLHWQEPSLNYWRRYAEKLLKEMRSRIDSVETDYRELLEEWITDGEILSIRTIDAICSYRTVERSKHRSIWECFSERAIQLCFPTDKYGGLYPIVGLYEAVIQDCHLSFLPVEDDKAFLTVQLRQAAEKAFSQAHHPGERPKPFSKETYQSLVSAKGQPGFGIVAAFEKTYTHFIRNDALPVLQRLLEQRYSQLKLLLK